MGHTGNSLVRGMSGGGLKRRQGDRRGWKEKKNLEVIWMEESTNWKLEKRKRKEWRLTYQFDCLYVPWTAREPDQRLGLRGGLWSLCFLWVWKMQEVLSINKHPKWTLFLKGSWIFRCAVRWHMGGGGGYKYEHEHYPRKLKWIKRGSKKELAEYQYWRGDGCIRIMEANVKNLVSWYNLRLTESK